MKGPMPRFSERFSVKGRAEKCKNEGIRVQNMSGLITAYEFGMVCDSADGHVRRYFPRFFTYSADYPEKCVNHPQIFP